MPSTNVAQALTRGAASEPEQLPAVAAQTSVQMGCTCPEGSHGANSEAQRNGRRVLTQLAGKTGKKERAVVAFTAMAACVVPAGMYTLPDLIKR